MRKYICLFLVGFFLGFWEDPKEIFMETQKMEINEVCKEKEDSYIFIHPLEEFPRLRNGDLLSTIMAKLRYPKEGCFGSMVVLSFTVNKKGLVEKPIIKKSICPQIDKQLLQIIEKLEFFPGKIDGKITSFKMNLPIRICLA